MAYAAAVSLMDTIKELENPTDPEIATSPLKKEKRNRNICTSVYAELMSLCETLKRLNASSSKHLSSSRRVIENISSFASVLDGRNYRSFDWSMISSMIDYSNSNSKSRCINRSLIWALDAEIREAVWKLEDFLQPYLFNRSLQLSGTRRYACPLELDLVREIHSFSETAKKLQKEYISELCNPSMSSEEDDSVLPIDYFSNGEKQTTIGLSDQIRNIRDEILDRQSGFKIVSLFGMAGIGKTHLAREICELDVISRDFEFTAWLRIGPSNEMENVLADIVSQIECKPRSLYAGEDRYTLAMLLQQRLQGRRYLIVLDDVWSAEVCDYLVGWLPTEGNGNGNGSGRILLTTRLEEVSTDHRVRIHQIRFLNDDESWNLLWQNVFPNKSFPPQLEKVGRKIAKLCEGLPLLILAVADILRGLDKTEEFWNKVADNKTTTFTDAYDNIEKVLYSSYEYLPQHLKACFLYMGVFPQRSQIRLIKLINLWVAEYFFEPGVRDLDKIAMECMKELVARSVAIVCKQSSKRRILASKLHSAYCHLCVKEAKRIKSFHVLKNVGHGSKYIVEKQRRLCVQNNVLFGIKEMYESMAAASKAQSLLCTGEYHEYPVPICLNLKLLKVLDALSVRFYEFPTEVVKLLMLRYLALTYRGELPSSISNLQQLQCLIVRQHHNIKSLRYSTTLPMEIWDMQQLRHLHIMGSELPYPKQGEMLENLFSLYVNAHSCNEAVFRGIPNVKKLVIRIELQPNAAETISCFEHIWLVNGLESLKCAITNPRLRSRVVIPRYHLFLFNLPRGLKELSLSGVGYPWKYINIIGSLSYLQVLKIRSYAFQGDDWETEGGEFPSLEFLLLEDIDVVQWRAEDDECFPCLQRLIIRHCYKLNGIPQKIGAIPTLETIEVVDCSPSVVSSAKQIQEKRASSVEFVISSSWNL